MKPQSYKQQTITNEFYLGLTYDIDAKLHNEMQLMITEDSAKPTYTIDKSKLKSIINNYVINYSKNIKEDFPQYFSQTSNLPQNIKYNVVNELNNYVSKN